MRLLLDTCVRWLIAAGLYLGAFAYFGAPESINFSSRLINASVAAAIVLATVLMTGIVLEGTNRCLHLLSCWCDPEVVEKWVRELDSPSSWRKRLALRTLTDYLGGNIGVIGPFDWCGLPELEAHAAIVKKLWGAKKAVLADCPSQERLLQRLGRKMKESFWRLAQCRIDWMVTQIPEYFRQSAAQSPSGSTQKLPGEDDISTLSEKALSLPEPLPPLDPNRLIDAMDTRITEILQKAAQLLNDAPPGLLIVASEEPVGELLAQLLLEAYQAGLLLRMGSSKIDVSELFSAEGGSLKKGVRLFEEMVERASNAVKDALMDLNILAEEVQAEPMIEELPFMSPDEFMVAMRPHVDEAFRQFVEITNQTPTGLILVAEEAGVCRLFARMHAQALELGLELRLRRAESLTLAGRLKRKEEPTPHLRKAASPSLPPPFMGWAEKYRHMRLAGTRFPLLREERQKADTSEVPHE
jgi:hypothetical protein